MPKIITLLSSKGGVCKTTSAMTIACGIQRFGHEQVLLVDSDTNQEISGALDWLQRAHEATPESSSMPDFAAESDPEILATLPNFENGVVVIDTSPRLNTDTHRVVVNIADLVIVVSSPMPADVIASISTARAVQALGKEPRILFGRVNASHARAKLKSHREALDAEGILHLDQVLREYDSVAESIFGALPGDYEGASARNANADALALAAEVNSILGLEPPSAATLADMGWNNIDELDAALSWKGRVNAEVKL